jgi:hypothetical protein
MSPGQHQDGTTATFEAARADFEAASRGILPTRTEFDFQTWRDQRDRTARKYAMWERGELLPTQKPNTIMPCSCGARFVSHDPERSYIHREHIYAQYQARQIRRREAVCRSAAGKAFLDVLSVFAEFETNLRKERQLEGIAKAKAEGRYKGRQATVDAAQIRRLKVEGGPAH